MGKGVGNLVDPQSEEILLPSFVERRATGLFVAPSTLEEGGLARFVERVFAAGLRFANLDYAVFQALLHDPKAMPEAPVRLAASIVPFPPQRKALYHTVKCARDLRTAEYLFEPVVLEIEEGVPVFGPPGEDGSVDVTGEEIKTRSEPTQLDFDEFVAALWEKGVRFGIEAAQVREVIQSGTAVRMEIARALTATPGRDASIEEKTDALHRDNAPKILPDGRMDMCQFKNRFPQITEGKLLLQKIPRELGKPGRNVAGERVEPDIPKDYNFAALAGPGTRVEIRPTGEFIVSAQDGFLNIDSRSNQVSVTEKMISREGVSMKTTGDVALTGDEFEEHGEVQERRVVKGRHMSFFADVYGNIVSSGGRVVLKANVAGGQISSPGGSITVNGRASCVTLEANGGSIDMEFAEGCTIVGSRVTIKHAINCSILGDQVNIDVSEGSAIAGKRVKIAQSTIRKNTETLVGMLVPDFTRMNHDTAEIDALRQEAEKRVAVQDDALAKMLLDNGFKLHLALATTLAKGGANLSPKQEASWQQTRAKYAAQMRAWQATQKARDSAQQKLDALLAELAVQAERKLIAGADITCEIDYVAGDTLVHSMEFQPDQSVVGGRQAEDIISHLREFGDSGSRLFWAETGSFSWRYGEGG
ncbi:MAG: FapA family protein [Thiobacillus sp.]